MFFKIITFPCCVLNQLFGSLRRNIDDNEMNEIFYTILKIKKQNSASWMATATNIYTASSEVTMGRSRTLDRKC